jgi:two-component system sensor histidine kinase UhpB
VSLFWRIFLLNATVLVAAMALLLLGPVTVSTPALLTEAVILGIGLVVMLIANAVLLRIGLAPLERLTRLMTTVDLLNPGARLTAHGRGPVAHLINTFNAMLERLEAEREDSNARVLSAQEAERGRIAQELHDEVGQTLTAVLLQLKRASDQAPSPIRDDLVQVQETIRGGIDELSRIARRLRPVDLDNLGLPGALKALANEFSLDSGLSVHRRLDTDLPKLSDEAELVLYRVAQEALTNAVRHANARRVDLELRRADNCLVLSVRDDGRGLGDSKAGAGVTGMRERARLVGGQLTVDTRPEGGTEVRLRVPIHNEGG